MRGDGLRRWRFSFSFFFFFFFFSFFLFLPLALSEDAGSECWMESSHDGNIGHRWRNHGRAAMLTRRVVSGVEGRIGLPVPWDGIGFLA